MNPDEYYTYEDRVYVSPTVSRDEQLGFVDTLRDTVSSNAARIGAQTQALGTNISPNLGGLAGSEGYFAQRYQTTPVEAQVKTLKATAQAKALNDLLSNYQSQAQEKYNQAYRSYKKRAASYGGGTGGTLPTTDGGSNLNITTETGAPDSLDVNENPNASTSTLIPTGNGTYKNRYTGETYSPAGSFIQALGSGGGMDLGVWPDGTKMTIGSTYKFGGNTYTYQQTPEMAYPSVFLVGDNNFNTSRLGGGW